MKKVYRKIGQLVARQNPDGTSTKSITLVSKTLNRNTQVTNANSASARQQAESKIVRIRDKVSQTVKSTISKIKSIFRRSRR